MTVTVWALFAKGCMESIQIYIESNNSDFTFIVQNHKSQMNIKDLYDI